MLADDKVKNLSIYNILSNGEIFDNIEISTSGILGKTLSGEYCLYSDIGSMKNDVWVNSILLNIHNISSNEEDINVFIGSYVLINGIYNSRSIRDLHSGTIKNIDRIRQYPLIKKLE